MFIRSNRSKEREIRESLLDSPYGGQAVDSLEELPSNGCEGQLIGLFEDVIDRFVSEGPMEERPGGRGGGVISVYEGGD